MSEGLFVGEGETYPQSFISAENKLYRQSMIMGNTVATLEAGRVIKLGYLTDRFFDMGGGIYLAPWDIIKGIIFGFVTKGAEKLFKHEPRKAGKAFRNGFVVGGAVGGLESILDYVGWGIDGALPPEAMQAGMIHETFQGILFQGLIAGLVNAGLTWAKI